jgi:hypothetical protein
MLHRNWSRVLVLAIVILLVIAACAPGNARWAQDTGRPANFWAGLWHGLIIVVTFIVSLFTREVKIYEVNNVGWAYNLGFLLGAMISLGGCARAGSRKKRRDPDWDRVGSRIAGSVREHLRAELCAEDPEWEGFSRRVEDRIRDEFKKGWKD